MESKQNRILIIEDDEIVRLNTSEYLLDVGFDVLTAEDGMEGVELATSNKPDMIICDIAMPILDGYQVYEKIKSNKITKYIPFIFLTARVDTPDILKGIKLGVDDYITKPFNLERLTAIINNKLKKNRELSIAAELKSRAYVETSENPVFIFKENRLVYLNPKFVKEFNLSKKEISDIYIKDLINETDCARLNVEINKCLNFKSKNFKIDCTTKPVSGVAKQFDIFGSLGEFEGSPAVQCNLYDISGTKDILNKINEVEKDYSDLLQMLPIGICKMDVYGKIIYSNTPLSRLTGYSPEELTGKFLWEVIGNPDDSTLIMDMLKKLREEYSKPFSIFSDNFTKEGRPYKTELQWDYIKDSDENNIGFLCLFIDTTERESVQSAYEESEKKFHGITDILSDWIWEIDKDGYYTYASYKVFDILGYTPEEIIGKKPVDLLKEEEIPKVSDFINNLMSKKTYFKNFLNVCKHKNGSDVYLESSGIPIYDEDGDYKGYYGIDRNITDIILTEKELNEAQKRLNILLKNNSEVAIYEFESDNEYISENLNTMLGYNNSKIKTKDNFYSIVNPKDIFELESIRDRWFESKDSSPLTIEYRLLDRSGNYIWFQDRMNIVRKKDGYYYVIGLLININERKKKETETNNLISALNQFPFVVMIFDPSGKINYVNNYFETETGIPPGIVKGKYFPAFFQGNDSEIINGLLKIVYSTKSKSDNFISLKSRTGELLKKHCVLLPVFSDNFEINNYILILNDIAGINNQDDELRKSISKAEELFRLKSLLFRNLSHEFRTPMNSILGYTEILGGSVMDTNQKKMIKGIEISARKLNKITNSTFKLSQIEILNNILDSSVLNLSESLIKIFESFIANFEEKKLKYDIQIDSRDLFILANYSFLEQSVSNIIDNSIKFTSDGCITLRLETFEGNGNKFALITIIDTGIGIPSDKIGYIFKDTDKDEHSYSSYFEGTGLGLTLSKKMIELMNGSIKVDSVYNAGTTVTIVFPLISN